MTVGPDTRDMMTMGLTGCPSGLRGQPRPSTVTVGGMPAEITPRPLRAFAEGADSLPSSRWKDGIPMSSRSHR